MSEYRYTKSHEWARAHEGVYRIGISDHAQAQLGEIVFCELPEVGRELVVGEECAVIESVKAAADVYAPLPGRVVAINEALLDAPEAINDSPLDAAWLFAVEVSDDNAFMSLCTAAEYQSMLEDA